MGELIGGNGLDPYFLSGLDLTLKRLGCMGAETFWRRTDQRAVRRCAAGMSDCVRFVAEAPVLCSVEGMTMWREAIL